MPPYEINGNQVAAGLCGRLAGGYRRTYLRSARSRLGRARSTSRSWDSLLTPNVGKGPKYPYYPFYGGVQPARFGGLESALNDGILGKLLGNGKTVLRGGYGRIYGRLNGVNLVLVPLLGPGLLQAVNCKGAS